MTRVFFRVHAHAKLFGAIVDGASQHEPVTWLVNVKRTRRKWKRQSTYKYWYFIFIANKKVKKKIRKEIFGNIFKMFENFSGLQKKSISNN